MLVSTSYLDEAERCEHAIVLHQGKVLAQGPPARGDGGRRRAALSGRAARGPDGPRAASAVARMSRASSTRCPKAAECDWCVDAAAGGEHLPTGRNDLPKVVGRRGDSRGQGAVRRRLHGVAAADAAAEQVAGTLSFDRPPAKLDGEPVVEVHDLVRSSARSRPSTTSASKFAAARFSACSGRTARARRRRFACCADCWRPRAARCASRASIAARPGLGPATDRLRGPEVFAVRAAVGDREPGILRQRVRPARPPTSASASIGPCEQFELGSFARLPSGQLPGGYKQRLAMAAALLHEPEILFLDEPTSGADPLARREFWRRITALAEQGVTVIVTTHFMEEAEYCDRVAIMDAGRVLAQGTPAEIRGRAKPEPCAGAQGPTAREPTMEDAFIAIVEDAARRANPAARARPEARHDATPDSLRPTAGRRPSCGASCRWCARKRGRSCAIRAASPSASCCR